MNPGMTVVTGRILSTRYPDDTALIDEDVGQATARVTSLAARLHQIRSLNCRAA